MKKYLVLLSSILIITSCDVEDGPFITDYDSYVNPEKKVLIEDFTGHLCPNCPDAARELDAIHDIYGDQIIGMAIHVSKSFARPYPILVLRWWFKLSFHLLIKKTITESLKLFCMTLIFLIKNK